MAQILTTITPQPTIFPYEDMDDIVRPRTDVPRAHVLFDVRTSVIDGAGVGDNQAVQIICDLPVNFSYVLTDFFCSIHNDVAAATNNFENIAVCNLNNGQNDALRDYTILNAIVSPGAGFLNLKLIKSYKWVGALPKFLLQPKPTAIVRLVFEFNNQTDDDSDYKMNASIRFLQYDINQTFHQQTNTPSLTR